MITSVLDTEELREWPDATELAGRTLPLLSFFFFGEGAMVSVEAEEKVGQQQR